MADYSSIFETFACLHVAFLVYVLAIILCGAIPAALGYSFGLRSLYVKCLLKIFEVSAELCFDDYGPVLLYKPEYFFCLLLLVYI